MSSRILASATALVAVSVLSACGTLAQIASYDQSGLPVGVQAPAGHLVYLETVGVGEITYECRDKKDAAGQTEWVFAGPNAVLNNRDGQKVGTYYGPPATWEANDGSKLTGTQVAVSPAGIGNIPLQLVKANPTTGSGAMNNITFVQRVATVGGVAPTSECSTATKGAKEIVKYQADYIFYKLAAAK